MAYVAVSRACDIDGLHIKNYQPSAIKTSTLIVEFYTALAADRIDDFIESVPLLWEPIISHPKEG